VGRIGGAYRQGGQAGRTGGSDRRGGQAGRTGGADRTGTAYDGLRVGILILVPVQFLALCTPVWIAVHVYEVSDSKF
jgi:hypothetical protein